jgi:riboflavin kinase/FMN adenylyltransferase
MDLIRRLSPPPSALRTHPGYVATIGSYDGLHRGHRALLHHTRQRAAELGLRSLLITFEPLPREYFSPQAPPARLTSFRDRWHLLQHSGLDTLCVLRFSEALRQLPGESFALQLQHAGVRHLVVGHDFKAARDGEASAAWLQQRGARFGFTVEIIEPVLFDGLRVSSRGVRQALADGDLPLAARLLGRSYAMTGRVQRGQQLGRTLGFPTANLRLARRRSPTDGIFAVRVRGIREDAAGRRGLPGVASLGTRPTVQGRVPLLEAHVFDFAGDLYGREIEVEFVARLRGEQHFESLDAMVVQMHQDAAAARAVLAADGDTADVGV